ncbi:cell wall-associated NlpC family hydrolase [Paraburkholderia atlantica]|uniref:hypothetical protein n=1 Tax=Paraburkholderia atlantica TaxID=2654982 RepID=UPI003D1C1ED1
MIWGYRKHPPTNSPLALCIDPVTDCSAIPRRANEILEFAPGVKIIARATAQVTQLSALQVGDLLFFDADTTESDAGRLDHVGMFMGQDTAGRYRFVSSRKTHNGPTFGDEGGASVVDGSGFYARSLHAARRL